MLNNCSTAQAFWLAVNEHIQSFFVLIFSHYDKVFSQGVYNIPFCLDVALPIFENQGGRKFSSANNIIIAKAKSLKFLSFAENFKIKHGR